ncbi:MAG TPA: glycosyltransferase [Gemmatimonadaceae bacterium]|nr:glycosyltransferase [Gemmatimonadaceae bacterium]
MTADANDISVIVCTRERPVDLARCLEALRRQVRAPLEVIVIDNAPMSDRTRSMAERYNVRYVVEPRAGLDRARNAGLRAARGQILAFTDDDAIPADDWTTIIAESLGSGDVAAMTGAILPSELETSAQRLFERYLERMTRRRPRTERRVYEEPFSPAASGQVGAGANMAFRRDALERVGMFDEAFDGGTATRSGGDTEMFGRLLAAGYRLTYEPSAVVRHRHRRSYRELRAQLFGYGVGVYAYWTHRIVHARDADAMRFAGGTLWWHLAHRLPRALLGKDDELPAGLVLAEVAGSLYGPFAYMRARRAAGPPPSAPTRPSPA